ncbi:unnamed protein product, partial [Meganyctiphanes norvegica]
MKKWERVLWKKQPAYPDNYVGESFLRVSRKRLDVSYSQALYGATAVSQEVCCCLGLVAIFYGLSGGHLKGSNVLIVTATLGMLGYIIQHSHYHNIHSVREDFKLVCFYCLMIFCAAPIIKSLTGSVATDSINACTTLLLLLRLLHHDYGAQVAIVNPSISHNLGVFASVCLASRLNTDLQVFSLITVAVALFALFPGFRNYCKHEVNHVFGLYMNKVVVTLWHRGLWVNIRALKSLIIFDIELTDRVRARCAISLPQNRGRLYGP